MDTKKTLAIPHSLTQRTQRVTLLLAALAVAFAVWSLAAKPAHAAQKAATSTADHGQFEQLKKKFTSGPEVTKACLECHTEAAKQIHKTKHWTWEFKNPDTGQMLGKRHVVNNYCIGAAPNIAACSSCHVGYGWKDSSYDFTAQENVDCLVCHDTTGRYTKDPKKKKPNLGLVARNVGPTSRASCGSCHFKGGGGAAVKHGDLDPTLVDPDMFVDVHMDADGLNFACATCHRGDQHAVAGSRYAPTAVDRHGIDVPGRAEGGRASCESCHDRAPHAENAKLNDHVDKIACQTCHIPTYSRGDFASKEWWDWSTAGKLAADNTPVSKADANGHEIYNSKKGDFIWRDNVVPGYVWFNGRVEYTLLGDKIDPGAVVPINRFAGGPDDPDSRIWPVKVMRGKQPFDTVNRTLAVPRTVGADGYWKTFDWKASLTKGMAAAGQPFSGSYGFVETTMLWPINHMVAPKEEALDCIACHAADGRLQDVAGVYIPGRDSMWLLDWGGVAAVLLTLLGVIGHGLARVFFNIRRGRMS